MKIKTSSGAKSKGDAKFQYLASFTGTLCIVASGMHYGWPSPSLPILLGQHSTIPMSNDEGSWMAVMPLIGGALGSLIAAVIVDILGRKLTIILCTFPYFLAWILVAFAKSTIVLHAARFIAGAADGLSFASVPIYIAEIAEPRIRGLLGSGLVVTFISGTLLINIIGSYLSIMTTALVSSTLPLLCLLTFVWMPESPYYLLMKNNQAQARISLQKFRGLENVDLELEHVRTAVEEQNTDTGKFLDLFTTPSNRKALLIGLLLRGVQQLSGVSAITFYTQPIFKEVGGDLPPELVTITYYSVQVVVTIFSSGLVDKVGRRFLLILATLGSAAALFVEGTYFYLQSTDLDVTDYSLVPILALLGFIILFSLGLQTIPLLILGELFPTNVKVFALCLVDIYFGIVASSVSKFFQVTKDSIGIYVSFYTFAGFSLLGLIFIILFVPETKGKTLEEIQMILSKSNEEKEIEQQKSNNV